MKDKSVKMYECIVFYMGMSLCDNEHCLLTPEQIKELTKDKHYKIVYVRKCVSGKWYVA